LKKSENLFQKQWIVARQHLILDDLILGRNRFTTTSQSCTKFSLLANKSRFVEAHKVLSHNDYQVCEFFKALRNNPEFVAELVVKGERNASSLLVLNNENLSTSSQQKQQLLSTQQIIPVLFQSLYGNCVLQQDEFYCLQLLRYLMDIQFRNDDTNDLRRLIRKQSCSFNILFKFYTSFVFSTQLFLTAALYEPISNVLTQEWFLDIDAEKALTRFSPDELLQRFGSPITNEADYKLKTTKYREKIVNQLYLSTMSFIDNINSNLFCFPAPLTWLVNQLYKQVISTSNGATNKQQQQQQNELARKLCCDLIMALYICPAICDPEAYGILSDVQMTTIARHNLMQIANILQVLAMSDDDKDVRSQDLYSKFRNVSEFFRYFIHHHHFYHFKIVKLLLK
jgi:hypothetical protein